MDDDHDPDRPVAKTRCHECWNLAQCCTCSHVRHRPIVPHPPQTWLVKDEEAFWPAGEDDAVVANLRWFGPLTDENRATTGKLTPIVDRERYVSLRTFFDREITADEHSRIIEQIDHHHGFN